MVVEITRLDRTAEDLRRFAVGARTPAAAGRMLITRSARRPDTFQSGNPHTICRKIHYHIAAIRPFPRHSPAAISVAFTPPMIVRLFSVLTSFRRFSQALTRF